MALATQPYKGARDFYPSDKRLQKYMFGIWREVCERFGYEEYDAPILERCRPQRAFAFACNAPTASLVPIAVRPDRGPGTVHLRDARSALGGLAVFSARL